MTDKLRPITDPVERIIHNLNELELVGVRTGVDTRRPPIFAPNAAPVPFFFTNHASHDHMDRSWITDGMIRSVLQTGYAFNQYENEAIARYYDSDSAESGSLRLHVGIFRPGSFEGRTSSKTHTPIRSIVVVTGRSSLTGAAYDRLKERAAAAGRRLVGTTPMFRLIITRTPQSLTDLTSNSTYHEFFKGFDKFSDNIQAARKAGRL